MDIEAMRDWVADRMAAGALLAQRGLDPLGAEAVLDGLKALGAALAGIGQASATGDGETLW